jgi:hypothetical protein
MMRDRKSTPVAASGWPRFKDGEAARRSMALFIDTIYNTERSTPPSVTAHHSNSKPTSR